jgi:hypothetical protein
MAILGSDVLEPGFLESGILESGILESNGTIGFGMAKLGIG